MTRQISAKSMEFVAPTNEDITAILAAWSLRVGGDGDLVVRIDGPIRFVVTGAAKGSGDQGTKGAKR